jgi:hypothetical protein
MRRGTAVLASAGAVLVALAAWVSTAGSVPIIRGVVPNDNNRGFERPPRLQPPTRPPTAGKTTPDQSFDVGLTVLMYAVLIALLVVLLVVLYRRFQLRRRARRNRMGAADAELVDDGWDPAAAEGLARSAARGLATLSEGEPRNAIVRCWTELEDAVEAMGVARDPALTSEEFTAEVLQRYAVGRSQIESLGRLYREARFSRHPMSERHRAEAVGALTALRDELRRVAALETVPASPTAAGGDS